MDKHKCTILSDSSCDEKNVLSLRLINVAGLMANFQTNAVSLSLLNKQTIFVYTNKQTNLLL
jgi:hypothetical protein